MSDLPFLSRCHEILAYFVAVVPSWWRVYIHDPETPSPPNVLDNFGLNPKINFRSHEGKFLSVLEGTKHATHNNAEISFYNRGFTKSIHR